MRDGLETVCVARWESPHAVRVHTELGSRRELYAGASGKLLLAHAPSEIQEAVLSGEHQRFTPNTILQREKLEKEIAAILKNGYSVSFAERTQETVAVAAPVYDSSRAMIAAISITGPSSRITQENLQSFIDFVKTGAVEMSRELGYAPAG